MTTSTTEQYKQIAEAMVVDCRVPVVVYVTRKSQLRAYASKHGIVVENPTTLNRLIIVAHECGHIYFRHVGNHIPAYRREYEACLFSIVHTKRYGFEVPEKIFMSNRAYVARKMVRGILSGLKAIDRACYEWSKPAFGERYYTNRLRTFGSVIEPAIENGNVELIELDRPDPTQPPTPRTRSLEVKWVTVGDEWVGRRSSLEEIDGYTRRYAPSWKPGVDIATVRPRRTPTIAPKRLSLVDVLRATIAGSNQTVYELSRQTGIAQPVLSRFTSGARDNLRIDTVQKLCDVLGLTLAPTAETSKKGRS